MLNKQATLGQDDHRSDETSVLSETSVPRLQSLVFLPSRSIFVVLREVDGLACSLPSLEDTGSSTPCQLPVLICLCQL